MIIKVLLECSVYNFNTFVMENKDFGVKPIIALIVKQFTNKAVKTSSIVRINSENLLNNGDISMPYNLTTWKSLFHNEFCNNKCTNILQHYLHLHDDTLQISNMEQYRKVTERLQLLSKNWSLQIAKYSLLKERLCLFLNRASTIQMAISFALENGTNFGQMPLNGKTFDLSCQFDQTSELTNMRLFLIKNVTMKLLRLQGYDISTHGTTNRIIFTVKSHEDLGNKYGRYVCGVVKNTNTKVKDTILTWNEYISNKLNMIEQLNQDRPMTENLNKNITLVNNMAKATVAFDMLSVKPTRSIFINSVSSEKGALFVLYNTARIVSILTKYHEGELNKIYPKLPNIQYIDFTQLNEEEEWELVYNYILKYPELIQDCIIHQPNFHIFPHFICQFLSRLCHKFSIYYHRTRILTEGCDHLLPKLYVRLYMLKALQIVLQNVWNIFDVNTMARM